MRFHLAASTLMSALLWSMLLSLFAAPALMAARGGDIGTDSHDIGTDSHTADLIRQHQEATSLFSPVPEMPEQQIQSRACGQPDDPAMSQEETSAPDDEPMIRPVGNRAKRIQV